MLLIFNLLCGGVYLEDTQVESIFRNEYSEPPGVGDATGHQNDHKPGPPEPASSLERADTLGGYVGLGFSNLHSNKANPPFGSRMMTSSDVSSLPSLPPPTSGSAAKSGVHIPSQEESKVVAVCPLAGPQTDQDSRPRKLSIQSTASTIGESSASTKMVDVNESPLSSMGASSASTEMVDVNESPLSSMGASSASTKMMDVNDSPLSSMGASSASAKMVNVNDSLLSSVQQRLTKKKSNSSLISHIKSMITYTDESPISESPAVELDQTPNVSGTTVYGTLYMDYYKIHSFSSEYYNIYQLSTSN